MKSRDEILVELTSKVRRAARSVEYNWPGTVCADDVEQELYVRLLELSDEALQEVTEQSYDGAVAAFRRMGNQIASQYAADYEEFTGNYRYSGDEVKELLARGHLVISDGMSVTERADLTTGMQEIPEQYADVLWQRFVEDENPDRRKVSRAVLALTREMNRSFSRASIDHSGPALRRDQ